ncbi:MAG: class I SAM-dependent methyltransferase [Planctomycetota bacterium]
MSTVLERSVSGLPNPATLERLLQRLTACGPSPHEYGLVSATIAALVGERTALSDLERGTIHGLLGDLVQSNATLLGHCLRKPYGYAGDFKIIDKIYTGHVAAEGRAARWDRYFHSLAAPIAVRNRKTYCKQLLRGLATRHDGVIRVLNLASGPARDLREFFDEQPQLAPRFQIDCVEADPAAIRYAQQLLGPHRAQVRFHTGNVVRHRPQGQYQLVWSAGLFDYFDDPTFVRVAGRFLRAITPGGELIIGNFHPRNPALPQMILQDWILHHRTEQELLALGRSAGVTRRLAVEFEPENVNAFLRMRT